MFKTPIVAAVLIIAATSGACASARSTTADSPTGSGTQSFRLSEWSVTAPEKLAAGKVKLTATNSGGETHELVIVRGIDPKNLPTKDDGSIDEDKIAESDKVGEIPDVTAGRSISKTFDLPAGTYVAFCNLVEGMGMGMGGGNSGMTHVHFQLGMVTTFTVS